MHAKQMRNAECGMRNTMIRSAHTPFINPHSAMHQESQGIPQCTKRAKKGFMHSLEGTIAAMLLLFYALQVFGGMGVQRADWTAPASKQEMQEFLLAVKGSDYKGLVFSGKVREFAGVSRFFLGEGRGYSVRVRGLPKNFFEVGVIANETKEAEATLNTTSCAVPTEFSCYNSTFKGVNYTLADYDAGAPNGREDYDALYFDFDNDGAFNSSEGPFAEGNIVNFGGEYWNIGFIDNATGNVSFWDAGQLVGIILNSNDLNINNRKADLSIRGATFATGFMEFDAVVIAGNINITPYESQLIELMQAGGGVVLLRNITSAGDVGPAEKNVFGLSWVYNGTTGTDNKGALAGATPGTQAYNAKKYFISSGITADTPATDTTGYVTDGIPNNETAHIGGVTLQRQSYAVLVTRSSGSPIYDRVRIDSNNPRNNFTDEAELSVGVSTAIGGNIYIVKEISVGGQYAVFSVKEDYAFSDFLPAGTKVYPVSGKEDYVLAKGKSRQYNITSRGLGSQTVTAASPCTGGEGTLPVGAHKCGTFYAGRDYAYAITNVSRNYTYLNIDRDSNGNYNDAGEPTYSTGTLVEFGPESYRAYVVPDGSGVIWALEKRKDVPYAVMNNIGSGTALWMPDTLSSGDEWGLFWSSVVASGRRDIQAGAGSAVGKWADARSIFFENNDIYQPYEVGLRMWY